MITKTQLKKLNKLWYYLPKELNAEQRQEFINQACPILRLTLEDLTEILKHVTYNKEKDKFVKCQTVQTQTTQPLITGLPVSGSISTTQLTSQISSVNDTERH